MASGDMVVLVLDETPIVGHDIRVNCELQMPETDLSGATSSSLSSEQGFKPKKLAVTMKMPFDEADALRALVQLAEKVSDSGERHIYQVINQTATAFGVRQVRFTERLRSAELEGEQSWQVTFTLLEYNSVPERVEAQLTSTTTVEQGETTTTTDSEVVENVDRSLIEKSLAAVDGWLAPTDET